MGTTLIFVGLVVVTDLAGLYPLIGLVGAGKSFLEITLTETVPETDTGGQVEYTKALERTMLKELGKLHA